MFATSANKSTANTATQHFINNNTNSNGLLNNGMMHLDNQVNNHLINNVNHIYQNQISTCGESYTPLSDKGYTSLSSMIRNIGTSTLPNINTTPQKNSNLNKLQLTNNSNLINLNYQNGQNFNLQNVALQQPNNTLAYHFSQDLLNQHQLQNIQHNNLIPNVPQQLMNGSQLPLQPKQLPQHNIPNIFCNLKNQFSTPQNVKHQQIQQQQQQQQPLTIYNMHQNNNFTLQKPDQSSQMNTGMTQSHQFYQHPSIQSLQQQQLQQIYLQLNNQNNPNLINRNLINNNTNHNLINRNLFNVNTTNSDSNYYNNLINCQNLNVNLQTNSMNNKSLINNNLTSTANNIDFSTTTSSFSNVTTKSESNDTVISGQLRNFKILKQIGTGQFSVVYRAIYIPTGQLFALKCIRIFELGDMKTRLDCINEISLLQRLDNPNIIKFYTSFVECNELYIVLEWADSGDLAQLLKSFRKVKKNIPERKIWFIFQQIANGLMHMHENCILHRDIKPPNVFITLTGVIKLGDLGLSKYYGSNCKGNCCCSNGNGFCLSNKEKNNNSSLDTRAILENHFNTLLSQKNNKNNPQNSVSLNNLVKACTQQVRNNISDHRALHYKLHKNLMQDEANSLIGTPFFMLQQNCKYDSQSDIWSLGCILYEMAALQSPFFGEKLNLVSLCQKIARCDYPPLSNQYSVALRALVASCLNTDPKQRPEISLICEIAKYCSELSSKELQVAHLYSPLFSTLKIDEIVNNDKINQYKIASTMSPLKSNNVYCLNGLNGRQAKSFNVNNQTNSNLTNQNHNLQNPLANCIPNNQTIVTENLKNFNNVISENFFNTTNGSNLANDCNNYNDLQSIDSDNTDSLLQFWKFEPDNEKNFI